MCTGNRTEGSNPSLSASPAPTRRCSPCGLRARGLPPMPCSPSGLRAAWGRPRPADCSRWSGERGADERDGLLRMPEHELGVEPEHPVTETPEHPVPARVRCAPPRVVLAVDLEHHPRRGRGEVDDEATD